MQEMCWFAIQGSVSQLTHYPAYKGVTIFEIRHSYSATKEMTCFLSSEAIGNSDFLIILSSSFVVFCWRMIDFLWKDETLQGFIIYKYQSAWIYNNITFKDVSGSETSQNVTVLKLRCFGTICINQ